MRYSQHPGASGAPPASPQILQRRRIVDRIGVSLAVADTLAGLVYGSGRRGDLVALAALTAERVSAGCGR